jgi:rhomboid-related protein 1/2/3
MTESDEPILTAAQLTKFQRMLRVAVISVVPPRATNKHGKVVVDDYVEQYNCKPPPLFMPIISIIEVCNTIVLINQH